jgi:hypothetical protein
MPWYAASLLIGRANSDAIVRSWVSMNSKRKAKLAYSFSVNRLPPPSAGQTILLSCTT